MIGSLADSLSRNEREKGGAAYRVAGVATA